MQTDDRVVMENGGPSRGRGALIGIAAALVVLVGGAIFLLTNDDPPVATPAPNATPLPAGDFPLLEPGAYYTDTDGDPATTPRGTFVIDDSGWASLEAGALREDPEGSTDGGAYVSLLVVELDQVSQAPCGGGAVTSPGTTSKALGDQFAAMPSLITLEGLTPVSAFGRDGYHLVLEVPGGCTGGTQNIWLSPVWGDRYYQAEGQIVEFWFLDVDGTTVMVEATRPPEALGEIGTELNADLDSVLDTLVITP